MKDKTIKQVFAVSAIAGGLVWLISALSNWLTSLTNGQPWIQMIVGVITLIFGFMLARKSLSNKWAVLLILGLMVGLYHVSLMLNWLTGWLGTLISVATIGMAIWALVDKK